MDDNTKADLVIPEGALQQVRQMNAQIEMLKAQLQTYVRGVTDSLGIEGHYVLDLESGVFRERSIDTAANGTVPERKEPITDPWGAT
jgi:hypothetical protein